MSNPSPDSPIPTLLLFADISGFTRYIRENPYTQAHAVSSIATLLDSVLEVLEPAWQLVKLEGDAAFCHAGPESLQPDLPELLLRAFAAFDTRKARLIAANGCECLACKALDTLDLKMILHRGEVVHYSTRRGVDLGGLPVIVLHRLSKNGVRESRYILWTEAMSPGFAALAPVQQYCEHCEGVGDVTVQVYASMSQARPAVRISMFERMLDSLNKARLWLLPNLQRKPGKAAAFGPK